MTKLTYGVLASYPCVYAISQRIGTRVSRRILEWLLEFTRVTKIFWKTRRPIYLDHSLCNMKGCTNRAPVTDQQNCSYRLTAYKLNLLFVTVVRRFSLVQLIGHLCPTGSRASLRSEFYYAQSQSCQPDCLLGEGAFRREEKPHVNLAGDFANIPAKPHTLPKFIVLSKEQHRCYSTQLIVHSKEVQIPA